MKRGNLLYTSKGWETNGLCGYKLAQGRRAYWCWGVYGHHGNYPEAVQVAFGGNRVEEAKVLQADLRFEDWPIVTL